MKGQKNTSIGIRSWIALAILVGWSSTSPALTLGDFLAEVRQDSPSYRSAEESADGQKLLSREADLIFAPQFFAQTQIGQDGKEQSPHTYDKIKTEAYSLGVSQQFSFGLLTKLSYNSTQSDFVNANTLFIPKSQFWDVGPKLELSMPLWGGGFGRSIRATQELSRQSNMASHYGAEYQRIGLLAQAEGAYWKLASWSDVVRIQEEALKAAQNIRTYLDRKRQKHLGEDADVVQAEALVEARKLQLQVAQNEWREALRQVNRFRHRPPEQAVDTLEPVDYAALEKMNIPSLKPGDRPDVKGTTAQALAAKANATIAAERNRPTLEIFGTYALNGRDKELDEAISRSGYTQTDTRIVGLRLNIPLDLSALADAKSGARLTERAAEYARESAVFDQEQDWNNLTKNLNDLRDNLKLLSRIESVQKAKLEAERLRLREGRTTTYQVLLFEQDYSDAAVSRVKSAAQFLALKTQIQLYQSK